MRTRTKQFATVVILLTSLLLSTITVAAQTGTNDWSRLSSVAAGSKLSVKLKNGKTIEGTLASISDTALTLTSNSTSKEARREDVATVHEVTKKSATKATLIGLGVGAGAGAVWGAVADANNNDSFEKFNNIATAVTTVLGAGAGALGGFLVGRSGKKRVLLYEAK